MKWVGFLCLVYFFFMSCGFENTNCVSWSEKGVKVTKGHSVTMKCKGTLASFTDHFVVDKLKNNKSTSVVKGMAVSNGMEEKILSKQIFSFPEGSIELFFNNVTLDDSGEYVCYTEKNPNLKSSFNLTVEKPHQSLYFMNLLQCGSFGSKARNGCHRSSIKCCVSYLDESSKEVLEIETDDGHNLAPFFQQEKNPLRSSDSGEHLFCLVLKTHIPEYIVANSTIKCQLSGTLQINTNFNNYIPEIKCNNSTYEVVIGENVNITCTIKTDFLDLLIFSPFSENSSLYHVREDNVRLEAYHQVGTNTILSLEENSTNFNFHTSVLQILSLEEKHFGTYTFLAQNQIGRAETKIRVVNKNLLKT